MPGEQHQGGAGAPLSCDPLKRDTQTDFYRLLELLMDDGRGRAGRERREGDG